jgi:ABC-type Fe3+-hydroxamate transport system substrate-binding protein
MANAGRQNYPLGCYLVGSGVAMATVLSKLFKSTRNVMTEGNGHPSISIIYRRFILVMIFEFVFIPSTEARRVTNMTGKVVEVPDPITKAYGSSPVQQKRVYMIPNAPFNWFDRPPSFMRLLGIKWLTNVLHPDVYPIDMKQETLFFHQLFFDTTLDDQKLRHLLGY